MSLADTLINIARARQLSESRFIRSLNEGIYPREALKIYYLRSINNCKYTLNSLISMFTICQVPKIRLHIIENICEEEGIVINPVTQKLERSPKLDHIEMFKKFSRSLDIRENEMLDDSWACKSDWLENILIKKQWQSAMAYIFVGGESNVPRFCKAMIPPLKENYGFTDDDLIFFHEHLTADENHGHIGAQLLAETIQTPEEKEMAIAGVRKGAKTWWMFHELCDREMRKHMKATSNS